MIFNALSNNMRKKQYENTHDPTREDIREASPGTCNIHGGTQCEFSHGTSSDNHPHFKNHPKPPQHHCDPFAIHPGITRHPKTLHYPYHVGLRPPSFNHGPIVNFDDDDFTPVNHAFPTMSGFTKPTPNTTFKFGQPQ